MTIEDTPAWFQYPCRGVFLGYCGKFCPKFCFYVMNRILKVILASFLVCLTCGAKPTHRVVGYVTSWSQGMPETDILTTINYAFAHVNDTFDGIRIDNPSRLDSIASLKRSAPGLEVLLSVGGWGSGGFSEMASDSLKRKSFAEACRNLVDRLGLDGIDIDWEYPGSSAAGISSSRADKNNFSLLMRDLRQALGEDNLLTMAAPATVGFYEFRDVIPYVDFINVMAYDLNRPPYHHSSLFRSRLSGDMTADEGIRAHLAAGIPSGKLILGVPFYGHGKKGVFPDFVDFSDIRPEKKMKEEYDKIACVPYIVDKEGKMVMTFENERSIARKCRYVLENGLGGIMFWEYGGDAPDHSLLRAIGKHLMTPASEERH